MCLNITTTYASCPHRLRKLDQCTVFLDMVAEAEAHYRKRHPWIHESDDEDHVDMPSSKCPMYYEQKEDADGGCVFCEGRKPKAKREQNKGARMTEYLDEMEARMEKKMEAMELEEKGKEGEGKEEESVWKGA